MTNLSKTALTSVALLPICAFAGLKSGDNLLQKANTSAAQKPIVALSNLSQGKSELKRKSPKKAPQLPAANTAGLPGFEGLVTYSTLNVNKGWYSIPTSDDSDLIPLTENPLGINNVDVYMAVKKDGLLYVHTYSSSFFGETIGLRAFDIETGVQKGAFTFANASGLGQGAATDPTTGDVYGIMYGNHLAKLDYTLDTEHFANPTPQCNITPIGDPDQQLITIACDNTGQLYGLDYDGNLYKVDKTDASTEFVGASGLSTIWNCSATIDPHSNRMFYAYLDIDYNGSLVEINLNDGSASLVYDYPYNLQVMGLTSNFVAEATAPGAATNLKAEFPGVELNGTISFTAPTTLFDGTPGTGNVDYKVFANDEEVAGGTTEYGNSVDVAIELTKSGNYTFSVIFYNEDGEAGQAAKIEKYVGLGELTAPTNVKLDYANAKATISWDPVTTSLDGSYIDPEQVTYTVTRSDGKVVADKVAETTVVDNVTEPEVLTSYHYDVVANYLTASSAAVSTSSFSIGCVALPYSQTWGTDEGYDCDMTGYTVIDGFNDRGTWTIGPNAALCSQNDSNPKDEYFILPPAKLKAGDVYDFSFVAEAQSGNMPEILEVLYGTEATVEGLKYVAYEPVVLGEGGRKTFTGRIAPKEDGEYHIAFHAISERDMWNVRLYNFTIEEGKTINIPDAIQNLKAKTEPYEYDVEFTFNAPSAKVSGDALETVNIEITRDGEVVKTFENTEAGSKITYVDTPDTPGSHNYVIRTYDETGLGSITTQTVFVYGYLPEAITEVSVEEGDEEGTVKIKWNNIITDLHGDVVPAGKITYNVYDRYGELVAEGVTTNRWEGQVCEPGEQKLVAYSVYARTDVGEGRGVTSDRIIVGTPYSSLNESFTDGKASTIIAGGTIAGYGTFYVATDETFGDVKSADSDNGYIYMSGPYIDDEAELFTGFVYVPEENPFFSFMVCNLVNGIDQTESYVTVSVKEKGAVASRRLFGGTVSEIAEGNPGWAKKEIDLEAYKGKAVQFILSCRTANFVMTPFDCFSVSGTSGVADIVDADAVTISSGNSEIVVSNVEGAAVTIASIDGKVVYTISSAPAQVKVPVAEGFYIVKAANKTAKLYVK